MLPLVVVLCLFLAGGGYVLGQRHINPLAWLPHLGGKAKVDPAKLAPALKERCSAPGKDRVACYSAALDSLAVDGKVREAMQTLQLLTNLDPVVKPSGHVFAHGIGISAEKKGGDIGKVFSQCDESNESGCYHGVLQAYFNAAKSIGSAEVNGVCSPYRGPTADHWLLFQCVHGTGHGLTMYYGHDVPRALTDCDFLPDEWSRRSCYAGVFMENIVNVQMASKEASGLNSHEGMHMEGMSGGAESHFKALDKNDLLYPCSIMAERYLYSCYEMQTAAILWQNGGNIAGTAKTCESAPSAMRYVCYQSLGRDISAFALADRAKAISLCDLGTAKYRPWCYFGLAKSFVNRNARPDEGIALCHDITAPDGKLKCYEAVGEMIATLRNDNDQRQALCKGSDAAYLDACLFGARVAFQPPEALARLNSSAH
jgi:hypothetical protein